MRETLIQTKMLRMFGSKAFFQLCAFLVLVGMGWFIYFSFVERDNQNSAILESLQQNNNHVAQLTAEVAQLKGYICLLQNQVESLGAVPAVKKAQDCVGAEQTLDD